MAVMAKDVPHFGSLRLEDRDIMYICGRQSQDVDRLLDLCAPWDRVPPSVVQRFPQAERQKRAAYRRLKMYARVLNGPWNRNT